MRATRDGPGQRARDCVDVLEFEREQRESELKQEIERLGAEAAASAGAAGAEELTALRAELEAAQAEARRAAARAAELEGGRAELERELKAEIERLGTELAAAAGPHA